MSDSVAESDIWFQIRDLRANPPKLAQKGQRRAAYGAAIQQADDLMSAAAVSGPAALPILLYYAYSQIGRAALAAHSSSQHAWSTAGHGLTEQPPDTRGGDTLNLQSFRVTTHGSQGLYGEVAELLGVVPMSESASVEELWAALPDLTGTRPSNSTALEPLRVWPLPPRVGGVGPIGNPKAALTTVEGVADATEFKALLQQYDLPRWALHTPQGTPPLSTQINGRYEYIVEFNASPESRGWTLDEHDRWFETTFAQYRIEGHRWCLPRVGGVQLDPALGWWSLLYILSSVARYRPDIWTDALSLERSSVSARLQALLERAHRILPQLMLSLLRQAPVVVPDKTAVWA